MRRHDSSASCWRISAHLLFSQRILCPRAKLLSLWVKCGDAFKPGQGKWLYFTVLKKKPPPPDLITSPSAITRPCVFNISIRSITIVYESAHAYLCPNTNVRIAGKSLCSVVPQAFQPRGAMATTAGTRWCDILNSDNSSFISLYYYWLLFVLTFFQVLVL